MTVEQTQGYRISFQVYQNKPFRLRWHHDADDQAHALKQRKPIKISRETKRQSTLT